MLDILPSQSSPHTWSRLILTQLFLQLPAGKLALSFWFCFSLEWCKSRVLQLKSVQLLQCTSGIRKSKTLFLQVVFPQFVTAGQWVGVASRECTRQFAPAERQAATLMHATWAAPPRAGMNPSEAHKTRF